MTLHANDPASLAGDAKDTPAREIWARERSTAERLDASDPLASFRDEFVIADPGLAYLDGNSLGRLPRRAAASVSELVHREWGEGLVRGWHDWIDLSTVLGDQLAPIVGAAPGTVAICDQTSVNLFKLGMAALAHTGRPNVVVDQTNFPSDCYVLAGIASSHGGELRTARVDEVVGPTAQDFEPLLDDSVGLISLSLVAFKSGAIADLDAITKLAHAHGALVLWDLSHAVGAIPIDLAGSGADLAVGCTSKW